MGQKPVVGTFPNVHPSSSTQTLICPTHSRLVPRTAVGQDGTSISPLSRGTESLVRTSGFATARGGGPRGPPHLLDARGRAAELTCVAVPALPRPRPALSDFPGPGPGRGRRCFASGSRASAQRKATLL
ncbi:hypothetical protein NN561_012093 [Cricetulus griseus]